MKVERLKLIDLKFDDANARSDQIERFFKRVKFSGDCWNFSTVHQPTGYGKFDSNGVTWRAHRWIMWAMGKIDRFDKACVLHSCDNRACVNPQHLRLGDRFDNAQDMKARNRTHLISDPKLGSKNPSAKLNEKMVVEIRKRIELGERQKHLAKEFGISKAVLSEIKTRKLWRHV
jgi:hypothetical protein